MKVLALLLSGLFCASIHAATSDILFPTGGGSFSGAAGNVVFNGQQFVTPVVLSNGAIRITFLDTNAVALSNISLSLTGSSPRLALNGSDYLLAWLNTNGTSSELNCARVSGGVIGAVSTIATSVANETVSINGNNAPFLAVWQSASPNSTVYARTLDSNGAPLAPEFAVAPSAQPQLYPSVDTDGISHLVCWMEQDVMGSNWRVIAQRISSGTLSGVPVTVSQSNSFRPYPTACSFGTNFLVVWSSDHTNTGSTDVWFPAVHGRVVADVPVREEFIIIGNRYWNANAALAFGGGRYLVTCPNGQPPDTYTLPTAQPLAADGTRQEFAIPWERWPFDTARVMYGGDSFCVIYSGGSAPAHTFAVRPVVMPTPTLTNVRRTANRGIAADKIGGSFEFSTNLVDWSGVVYDLTDLTNRPQLFVRVANHKLSCIEQLRGLHWAKQRWAFDYKKVNTDSPLESDLFGSTRYLTNILRCPGNGTHTFGGAVDSKPTCTLSGHTL